MQVTMSLSTLVGTSHVSGNFLPVCGGSLFFLPKLNDPQRKMFQIAETPLFNLLGHFMNGRFSI